MMRNKNSSTEKDLLSNIKNQRRTVTINTFKKISK